MRTEEKKFTDPESFRDAVGKVVIEQDDNPFRSWLSGIEERGDAAANDVFARNIAKGFDTVRKLRARVLRVTGGTDRQMDAEDDAGVEWAKAEHTDPVTLRDAVEIYAAEQEDPVLQSWLRELSLRDSAEVIDIYRSHIREGRDSVLGLRRYLEQSESEGLAAAA